MDPSVAKRNKRVTLLQQLGRGSRAPVALMQRARPPEPRMARALYLRWVKAFFQLWRHAVAEVLDLRLDAARADAKNPLLQARWNELVSASGLPKMLDRITRDVNAQTSRYFEGIVKTKVPPGDTAKIVSDFRKTNVELISNLGSDQVSDLTATLEDASARGLRHEDLADLIDQRIGVGESRAKLIARDQTLKYQASAHEAQAMAAGIEEFTWSTSHDGAVRPMHRELDGRRFRYDDPPGTNADGDRNLPGQDYQCRCQAIPVIPLFDDLNE